MTESREPGSSEAEEKTTDAAAQGEEQAPARKNPLPPPAFPPGSGRAAVKATSAPKVSSGNDGDGSVPEDAFISPDDPIQRNNPQFPEDAFISPDDPIRPAEGDEEGIVTGMGEGGPVYRRKKSKGKPSLREAAYYLEELSKRIRDEGEAALHVDYGTEHFEGVLAAFLAGYFKSPD